MSEDSNGKVKEEKPTTEVVAKATRKRFTAAEKLRILREVDACQGSGEIGALLRREGIYSSYLTTWRRQRERGELDGLAPQKRGPKPDPQAIEIARRQEGKSLELRATMSLSRLWSDQGKKADARQVLAEIYEWFTEGFDTADLQEAKGLLEERIGAAVFVNTLGWTRTAAVWSAQSCAKGLLKLPPFGYLTEQHLEHGCPPASIMHAATR